jgi:antitoxin PrlF
MEATVAERGQITLPKAVRDALGLTKGTLLKVELDGGRIILRKNVDDAISRARGRFKLPPGKTTDDIMRELRGRAPGDPLEPSDAQRDAGGKQPVAAAMSATPGQVSATPEGDE